MKAGLLLVMIALTACSPIAETGLATSNAVATSALATLATIAQLTICLIVLGVVVVAGTICYALVRGPKRFQPDAFPPSKEHQSPAALIVLGQTLAPKQMPLRLPEPKRTRRVVRKVNVAQRSAARVSKRWFR